VKKVSICFGELRYYCLQVSLEAEACLAYATPQVPKHR
jgi:hypothetical protein